MKRIFFIFILLLTPYLATARDTPIIIYFGGADSQKTDLDRCFPNFRNYGYPVSQVAQDALVQEIKQNPRRSYILAGHSSGSRYAINIAKAEGIATRSRLTLVSLDGFAPRGVPQSVRRICWNAANRSTNSRSRNFSSMTLGNNCGEVHTHYTSRCGSASKWCLHFSVVNPATPTNLNDWAREGYNGCSESGLEWLQLEQTAPDPSTTSQGSAR